jgi:hypothetical protein
VHGLHHTSSTFADSNGFQAAGCAKSQVKNEMLIVEEKLYLAPMLTHKKALTTKTPYPAFAASCLVQSCQMLTTSFRHVYKQKGNLKCRNTFRQYLKYVDTSWQPYAAPCPVLDSCCVSNCYHRLIIYTSSSSEHRWARGCMCAIQLGRQLAGGGHTYSRTWFEVPQYATHS